MPSISIQTSGNSGTLATASGTFTPGNFVMSDTNGNMVDSGISGSTVSPPTTPSDHVFNVFSYGAVGDGVTDDTSAIQAAINATQSASVYPYAPRGRLFAPEGYCFKITSGLVIDTPINVDFRSIISYAASTGSAVTVCSVAPTPYMNWCDISFQGFMCAGGNSSVPTSMPATGTTALRVNFAAFCTFNVRLIQGFTRYGVYLDGLGDVFTNQVIQHNEFNIGHVVYCGIGIFMNSLDAATSSAEANRINIKDINGCWINIQLDDPSHGASTSNRFIIDAMDDNAPNSVGGHGALIYGSFNFFDFTYLGTDIYFGPSSTYNTTNIYNPTTTGSVVFDAGTKNHANIPT